MAGSSWFSQLALVQGGYYLLTAVWSLVSPGTFQAVTGPKRDYWLVRTVGVLVGVIGGVLAMAGLRRQTTREVPVLAIGSAAGLAAIDVVYAGQGRISKVYLLDALAEVGLIAAWAFVRRRGRSVSLFKELFRSRDQTYRDAPPLEAARQGAGAGEALGI
jgi:hypothetical protein